MTRSTHQKLYKIKKQDTSNHALPSELMRYYFSNISCRIRTLRPCHYQWKILLLYVSLQILFISTKNKTYFFVGFEPKSPLFCKRYSNHLNYISEIDTLNILLYNVFKSFFIKDQLLNIFILYQNLFDLLTSL